MRPVNTFRAQLDRRGGYSALDDSVDQEQPVAVEIFVHTRYAPSRPEPHTALRRPGRETELARFQAVARDVVTITVRPEPCGSFELYDLSNDGQLSFRELADLGTDPLTRAGNVQLPIRIPDSSAPALTVLVSRGIVSPPPVRLTKAPPPQRGPEWFRALDRNGDVSRKAFVGTQAQFNKNEANGDGLISADEAEAGDKQFKG